LEFAEKNDFEASKKHIFADLIILEKLRKDLIHKGF